VWQGKVWLIPQVPRRLKSSKTLQHPDGSPTEQPGGPYVVIEPITNDDRLGRGTARTMKSELENRRIGLFQAEFK
jgi:hypothetical protein